MNLSQLEVLVAIVDAGSLTEAAEAVGLTQSAVSHSLNRLEAELGVTLLERGRQGISVSRIGQEVVNHARIILSQTEIIRQKTARARGVSVGKLRFGCVPHVSPRLLTGIIRDFQHRYPEIEIVLFEGKSPELMNWLQEGIIDAAMVLLPDHYPLSVPLARDEIKVILAESHPLATADKLTLAQLSDEPLIAPQDQYQLITSLPQLQHVSLPHLHYAVSAYHTIFGMVRENMGVSLLPGDLITPVVDGIVSVPLVPPLVVDVYLAASVRSPVTEAFLNNAHTWSQAAGFLPDDT